MLANSHNFLFQKRNGFFPSQDDTVALELHHKALRHTSDLMKDPTKHQSDEIVAAVISLMIHHVSSLWYSGGALLTSHRHCSAILAAETGKSTATRLPE
jgi:hypothetical protein